MDSSRVVIVALSLGLLVGAGALATLVLLPEPSDTVRPASPLAANLGSLGLDLDLSTSATVDRADVEENRLVHMLVHDGDARVRIRATHDLDPAAAERRIAEARQRIDALFGERQAPYPGELSNTLKCPEAFKPVDHTPRGTAHTLVRLYANERLAFGGCADDLLAYRVTIGQYYDPASRRLVEVEYFSPRAAAADPGPDVLAGATLGEAP